MSELRTRALTGFFLVAGIVTAIWCGRWSWTGLVLLLAILGFGEAQSAMRQAWPSQAVWIRFLLSFVLVALPTWGLSVLGWQDGDYDPLLPLGWFILLWVNDTGAYLVGRKWGRRRIAPSISPGKTWEGWAGGAAFTLAVAFWVHGGEGWGGLSVGQWCLMGAVVAVFGPMGDFAESALKRRAGIKDSGSILPGHGGILDRFDSHFISAPIAAILLQVF